MTQRSVLAQLAARLRTTRGEGGEGGDGDAGFVTIDDNCLVGSNPVRPSGRYTDMLLGNVGTLQVNMLHRLGEICVACGDWFMILHSVTASAGHAC